MRFKYLIHWLSRLIRLTLDSTLQNQGVFNNTFSNTTTCLILYAYLDFVYSSNYAEFIKITIEQQKL